MATIEINTPDGKTIELNAPDGASDEDIRNAAKAAADDYAKNSQVAKPDEVAPKEAPKSPEMANKAPSTKDLGMLSKAPLEAAGALYDKIQDSFNRAGENFAQNLAGGVGLQKTNPLLAAASPLVPPFTATPTDDGSGMKVPPVVAAVAGTVVQNAPDLALNAVMAGGGAFKGANRFKDVVKAIVGIGEKGATNEAGSMMAKAEDALRVAKTGVKEAALKTPEVLELESKAAAVKDTMLAKKSALLSEKEAAGKAIGAAEKEAGVDLKNVNLDAKLRKVTRSPERLDNSIDVLEKITDRGVDYLKTKDVDTLQRARKFAEEGLRKLQKGTPQYARMAKSKQVLTEALGEHASMPTSFKESIGRFRNVSKALESLPAEAQREAAGLKSQIKDAMVEIGKKKISAQEKAIQAEKMLNEIRPKAEELIRKGVSNDLTRKKALYWLGGAAVAGGFRKVSSWRPG